MLHGSSQMVAPEIIAFVACLKEVQKSFEEEQGSSFVSDSLDASRIAALSKSLYNDLNQTDSPFLAAAKMQVTMHAEP